ncbi:MAG: hypothetical protein OK452_06600 [Thaumarchaeota archaeon]|nr:hypothetical protein [Nitrososphaerota archaeon]
MQKRVILGFTIAFVVILIAPWAGKAQAQATPPSSVSVLVQFHPGLVYDVYGSSPSQALVVLNGNLSDIPRTTPFLITTNLKLVTGILNATVNGQTEVRNLSPGRPNVTGPINTYALTLPAHITRFELSIQGTEGGFSFLWRYLVPAPYVQIAGLPVTSQVPDQVAIPSGTVLSHEYGPGGSVLALSYYLIGRSNGEALYSIPYNVGVMEFQSNLFLPASIAITSVSLIVVALLALNFFEAGRRIVLPMRQWFDKLNLFVSKHLSRLSPRFKLRAVVQPRKFLALFVLCALVMAAGAAVGGPDPRIKALIISDPANAPGIANSLQQVAGNTQVTIPSQDPGDFAVMSSEGAFNVVVISNYPVAQLHEFTSFILPSLGNVPIIIVDKSANANLSIAVMSLYPGQVYRVQNASSLSATEMQTLSGPVISAHRTNELGLQLSVGGFQTLLAVEGVLSFVLVFLGWAYLGSLASEPTPRTDLSNLVRVVSAGVFVFIFSETVYIATSSLLALPLSLHAVTSGAHDLTAVGVIGFGGGSTPRLAAGVLGVLVGLIVPTGSRISRNDFLLIAGVLLVLVANPLTAGQFLYEGMLFFVGPYWTAVGTALSASLSVKGFLYGIGGVFGGNVSPVYLMSAGKILYFAGVVPLAFLPRMGKLTGALTALGVALLIGDGGVRVGEMTPTKTVIAVIPGVVAGFAIAAILLALAAAELYARGNWRFRR